MLQRRPEEADLYYVWVWLACSSSITMKQDISLGIRPQAAMLEGVFEVAQAVRVTMGPRIQMLVVGTNKRVPQPLLKLIKHLTLIMRGEVNLKLKKMAKMEPA
ncbi:hypothetical protein F2Q70_00010984 [Brassica cretica]|uniref:Uncharacterized protein n=1 Tax=Brassica cretica TaxID=69181 RepID=A0A8S9M3E4_BRACR|nr:hypothetical protein F2Q70_00010984 [Brassica cretica]